MGWDTIAHLHGLGRGRGQGPADGGGHPAGARSWHAGALRQGVRPLGRREDAADRRGPRAQRGDRAGVENLAPLLK